MDWIDLEQNEDQWRAPVNMVMNLRVPLKCWQDLAWVAAQLTAPQEGLSSTS
jgi:hypothetical protein